MIRNSTYYWSENSHYAHVGADKLTTKDTMTYAASGVVGALIAKSFIAGPLGLLLGAAAGVMGASAIIKSR